VLEPILLVTATSSRFEGYPLNTENKCHCIPFYFSEFSACKVRVILAFAARTNFRLELHVSSTCSKPLLRNFRESLGRIFSTAELFLQLILNPIKTPHRCSRLIFWSIEVRLFPGLKGGSYKEKGKLVRSYVPFQQGQNNITGKETNCEMF
jgi:hypothetical protein